MAYGKKNVVQIDPLRYGLLLLGESKAGKTFLIYQYCKKLTGSDDGYLFFEIGAERGADAISGINYVNTPRWNMEYDEYTNSVGFADVCEDIIDNKATEYPNLRVVVWDTLDQLIACSEEESIRLYNKEAKLNGKPIAKSVNSAWGGFGRAEKKAIELMMDYKNRLLEVGVQTIIISHCKRKDITDIVTGEQYQVLTSDQQQNYFNAFKKDMHFIALLYVDRTITKESSGRKDINGRDIKINKLTSEARRIKFRDTDNFTIDSGSRFADIVEEIPCDVDEFIKAITDAIIAEAKKGDVSVDQLKKEQDAEAAKRTAEIAEAEAKRATEKELNSILSQIKDFFIDHKDNRDVLKPIMQEVKSMGYDKPMDITNIEEAKKILSMCE